jgi:hypothetical protein
VVIAGADNAGAIVAAIGDLAMPLDYEVDVDGFTVVSDERREDADA